MRSTKGQAIVEFALIIPIFAMLLFGIVDFGRAFHAHLAIDHASREAAREASVGGSVIDETAIDNVAVSSVSTITLNPDNVTPTLEGENDEYVRVTVSHPFDFLTPVISNIAGSITLENSTVMRLEK